MGTIPQKDIDAAQEKIIKIIHELQDNGEIFILANPEDTEKLTEDEALAKLHQPRRAQDLRQYINE